MLEFCRTVDPNLQDYEADGVRFFTFGQEDNECLLT